MTAALVATRGWAKFSSIFPVENGAILWFFVRDMSYHVLHECLGVCFFFKLREFRLHSGKLT